MNADGNNLGKGGNLGVNAFGKKHKPVRRKLNIFLHKAVEAACTEFARTQIVFGNDFVLLNGCIRNHNDLIARLEASVGAVNDFADTLVNQRHRKLFGKHLCVSCTLIISLVGVADRKILRTDNDLGLENINFIESDFKFSRLS